MSGELISTLWTIGITVTVAFLAFVGVGFWFIAKRNRTSGGRTLRNGDGNSQTGRDRGSHTERKRNANIALVRADDAVRNAEDELGYAIAQFGTAKTEEFARDLLTSKATLREAFALQQKLDDVHPDSNTQRREWNASIIHLCTTAQAAVEQREKEFAALRDLEMNAPENLAATRKAIEEVKTRSAATADTLTRLKSDYDADAIATVADNIDQAKHELEKASASADRAHDILDGNTAEGAGSESASEAIHEARDHATRAGQLLDAIDTLRDELAKAADAVTALRESTRKNLDDARALRDSPPDADASAEVEHAIRTVEQTLASHKQLTNPVATLEKLMRANSELDASMAGARNQQRRLDGARTALVGALVGAHSQLAATRDFIALRRNHIGAEARTRLAEAERLLTLAEAESDPVAALDLARSSSTHSRDADALARYDLTQHAR